MTWLARARMAAWVTVVVVASWGIWSVRDANHDLAGVVDDLQDQRDVDRARACVNSWEARGGIRTLIDTAVAQSANPGGLEAFRELIDRELPDPTCDLAAARRRVDEADR